MAPRSVVLIGSDHAAYSIGGSVPSGEVYPGRQLVAQQFGRAGGRQVPGIHGERTAISVELVDPDGVADLVETGSWVAMFVSEGPEPYLVDGATPRLPPLTRILLPKVQVLGVGKPADDSRAPAEQAPRTILTIAVTQAEAEKVICGSRNGHLTFALRSDRSQVAHRQAPTGHEIQPELYGSAS